jgi:UDP-glucuronate 4-epimerase
MKIIVTGSAGFIGFHVATALLKGGHEVIGIDNINDYYDVSLKYRRLNECGIEKKEIGWYKEAKSHKYDGYIFIRMNLEDKSELDGVCRRHNPDVFINLAAQAGVRHSLTHPESYVQSNLVGFLNVLEACRSINIKHLIYASSSSVYGLNAEVPFSAKHSTNHPASLYAATKKANELMAHAYSYLYNLPTTGLRFFTVYGPWGRPDMACFLFADAIVANKPIQVFNNGHMKRDFTYIDDIVAAIQRIANAPAQSNANWNANVPDPSTSAAPYRIYNIGNNNPVELLDFIKKLENSMDRKAILEMRGMQAGDVVATWANVDDLATNFDYSPDTDLQIGLDNFISWYKQYYSKKYNPKPKARARVQAA